MNETKTLKYTSTGARILLGLVFFLGGIAYFFMGDLPIDPATPMGRFASGLLATGYFFPFLKITEAIAGFMLFFKRWTPLSLLILAPIILNILLVGIFLDQSGLVIGVIIALLAGFLAWCNWDKYAGLFKA
ncbi:acyltransferase [Candidatus Woesearchaeota archaeon]|nr:acyltransferase [Candidatus Woesearchaeota archaeon]